MARKLDCKEGEAEAVPRDHWITVNGIDASVFSHSKANVPWFAEPGRNSILKVSTVEASFFTSIFVRPKSRVRS